MPGTIALVAGVLLRSGIPPVQLINEASNPNRACRRTRAIRRRIAKLFTAAHKWGRAESALFAVWIKQFFAVVTGAALCFRGFWLRCLLLPLEIAGAPASFLDLVVLFSHKVSLLCQTVRLF